LSDAVKDVRGASLSTSGRSISGEAEAKRDGEELFICVPYDRGWGATVNGKKVKPLRTFDAFISLPLEAGENDVEMKFLPYGMKSAVLLTALAGLICLVLLIRKNRGFKINCQIEEFFKWLLIAFFAMALLLVTLAPVLIWLLA
jgi:uncharacterized membrane protein YfhO